MQPKSINLFKLIFANIRTQHFSTTAVHYANIVKYECASIKASGCTDLFKRNRVQRINQLIKTCNENNNFDELKFFMYSTYAGMHSSYDFEPEELAIANRPYIHTMGNDREALYRAVEAHLNLRLGIKAATGPIIIHTMQ